uniref:Uncharacterized protein LOC111113694 n=1 Tax=Crassostrea virginica TaxID=6565 RepID=A0A8B8BWE5_CRAVI|nr:uncharacterized protein LOC111113694 [Crassostrea virginica]
MWLYFDISLLEDEDNLYELEPTVNDLPPCLPNSEDDPLCSYQNSTNEDDREETARKYDDVERPTHDLQQNTYGNELRPLVNDLNENRRNQDDEHKEDCNKCALDTSIMRQDIYYNQEESLVRDEHKKMVIQVPVSHGNTVT